MDARGTVLDAVVPSTVDIKTCSIWYSVASFPVASTRSRMSCVEATTVTLPASQVLPLNTIGTSTTNETGMAGAVEPPFAGETEEIGNGSCS